MNQNLTFQQSIDLFPDAIILVGKDSVIVASNRQVEIIFGYKPEALAGKNLKILIPERYRENHDEHVNQYFTNPEKRRMGNGLKFAGLKKDGSEIDVDIALAPVMLNAEQYVMATIRDITDLKELERNLLKKNEELSLSNTHLERMGYVIAHDLKSPLLNLQAVIHLLSRELSAEKSEKIAPYNKALNEILASMMELIHGVTNYSKANFTEEADERVNLNAILQEVRRMVHCPPNFELNISQTLPVIHGNKTKVLQIFLNLINNAIKYNDKKTGLVEIRAYQCPSITLICISDNGPGVPDAMRDQIFELFRKGDIEKQNSQGIGLTVVKKIIEDHGGGILVQQGRQGGADFMFSWPANPANAAKSAENT